MESNPIFFTRLSDGNIKYNDKYPFLSYTGKDISNNGTGYKNDVNISLLDAQIKTINDPSLVCFNFHPQPYVNDISEGTLGNAVYFNSISNNSILGVSNEITSYIIKNNGSLGDLSANFTETSEYYGELDYIEFSINEEDVNNIKNTLDNLNNVSLPNGITINNVSSNRTVDYYFYIWQDINGPWYNGSTLSMTPNKDQLVDEENNVRISSYNTLDNLNDLSETKLYTYNYVSTNQPDTTSNYISIFKISGDINNGGMPLKSAIRITKPKYTKYTFIWTYKINNGGTLSYNSVDYNLSGIFPYYTPNIQISNIQYKLFNSITSSNIERVYKPQRNPDILYIKEGNNHTLKVSIPRNELIDISRSFINRYSPDDRIGTEYDNRVTTTTLKHPYENNEIIKLRFNIFVFKDNNLTHIATSNSNTITIDENNRNNIFTDVSSNFKYSLNDNSVNILEINNYLISNIESNWWNLSRSQRNQISNNFYIDATSSPNDISFNNFITTEDLSDNYYAYEEKKSTNDQILHSRDIDGINEPSGSFLKYFDGWCVFYKTFTKLPESIDLSFNLSDSNIGQGNYSFRWSYSYTRYNYNKNYPMDPYYRKITDISLNFGLSNSIDFDFTQFGKFVRPDFKLDLSFTTIVDDGMSYYNLNVRFPPQRLLELYNSIAFNYGKYPIVEPTIYIYGQMPKKYIKHIDISNATNSYLLSNYGWTNDITKKQLADIKGGGIKSLDQLVYSNNEPYDTRQIPFKYFDISYSYTLINSGDAKNPILPDISFNLKSYPIPYNLNDIEEYNNYLNSPSDISGSTIFQNRPTDINSNISRVLRGGRYVFEWFYDLSENEQLIDVNNIFNRYEVNSNSPGYYIPSKTAVDISLNLFLNYDLSNIKIYLNPPSTNLIIKTKLPVDLFKTYIEIKELGLIGLDYDNIKITPNFLLYEPGHDTPEWYLPDNNYLGQQDNRLYNHPTIDNSGIFYLNTNNIEDIGFKYDNASFNDDLNTFKYSMITNIFDIINKNKPISSNNPPSNTVLNIINDTLWNSSNKGMTNGFRNLTSNPVTLITGTSSYPTIRLPIKETDMSCSSYMIELDIISDDTLDPSNNYYMDFSSNIILSNLNVNDPEIIFSEPETLNQTIIGLFKGGGGHQSNGFLYKHNGILYQYPVRNINGPVNIKWLFIKTNENTYTANIFLNDRLLYSIENGGIDIYDFTCLGYKGYTTFWREGGGYRDGSWNYYVDLRDTSFNKFNTIGFIPSFITEYQLYETYIYRLISSNDLGKEKFNLSTSLKKNDNIIPYVSRIDIQVNDNTNKIILDSIIKKTDNRKNRLYNWIVNDNKILNKNYNKYTYGITFFKESDTILNRTPFYPKSLYILLDINTLKLNVDIPLRDVDDLFVSFIEDWNIDLFPTDIKIKFYEFHRYKKNENGRSKLTLAAGVNEDASVEDIINGLKNVNLENESLFDNVYSGEFNPDKYTDLNFPNISSTSIQLNNWWQQDIWITWSYVVDNRSGYLNEIPKVTDYDISFNIYKNNTVYLEYEPDTPTIEIDSSSVIINLNPNTIQNIKDNLTNNRRGYIDLSDINMITFKYYLWRPEDVTLPNNYKNYNDIRLKQNPTIFYNTITDKTDINDISYSYLLDLSANIKTKSFTDINSISITDLSMIFTNTELGYTNQILPYTSTYMTISSEEIPYIARWSLIIDISNVSILDSSMVYYSDISESIVTPDNSYQSIKFRNYRINNFTYTKDSNNNFSIIDNSYNKYNYALKLFPDPILNIQEEEEEEEQLEEIKRDEGRLCDLNCNSAPTITKTNESLTSNQLYSNSVKINFDLANRISIKGCKK